VGLLLVVLLWGVVVVVGVWVLVWGLVVVVWQLRVAAGDPLPAAQKDIRLHGHAIEARIYAEDPSRDFAPSIGRLTAYRTPPESPSVRIDTGVRQGDTISTHYDAMIAKLICHAATRDDALATLRAALAACDIAGVTTNLDLLSRIAATDSVAAGGIDTGFIERHADTLLAPQPAPPLAALAAAALGVLTDEAEQSARTAAASGDPWSPWQARDGWWLNARPERVLLFGADTSEHPVRARRAGDTWRISAGDQSLVGRASRLSDGRLAIDLDGVREHAGVERTEQNVTVRLRGETWRFHLPDPAAAAEEDAGAGGRLVAPIPGQVTEILAEPGQQVKRGDVLVILEAMKTVFRLAAQANGTVDSVACRAGETVDEGQLLVSFVEDASEKPG
jgi:3-methylcrotonyl-CoA carboxylase alpha subunit